MEHCNTVSSVMWLSLNSVLRLGRTLRCGAVPHMVGAQPVQVAEILKQRERNREYSQKSLVSTFESSNSSSK